MPIALKQDFTPMTRSYTIHDYIAANNRLMMY